MAVANAAWKTWSEAFPASGDWSSPIWLTDRLLSLAIDPEARQRGAYLQSALLDIAAEFGARGAAVWERRDDWVCLGQWGSVDPSIAPKSLFAEAIDRGAAGFEDGTLVVPLGREDSQRLLWLTGRGLSPELLAATIGVGRALSIGFRFAEITRSDELHADRLRTVLGMSAEFTRILETEPLLNAIAEAACDILHCDRASIFIWDKPQKEVIAKPAIGVPEATLRIPDNVGIVGSVLRSGERVRVDDAKTDTRFGSQVDKQTGYQTKTLLAEPMRNRAGEIIGVFEAINRLTGNFNDDDADLLGLLATQAAVALENAQEREDLVRSRESLAEQVTSGVRLIGVSAAITGIRATVERLAETDLPVLILGESGTGKEVVAQSLHFGGARRDHPFVAVNCAALAESLLESELFGHERGAFTDAREARAGKFELADGGTLFLDEIGDMSLGGQAKLLRVLEQKVITRVGGAGTIPVNVRIVAATNANLPELVRTKKFREDLYYRLSVVTQQLPPLRDRAEDIIPLAEFFLKEFCQQSRRPRLGLSADAKKRLQAHHWPGNVRELRNLMERVAFLAAGEKVVPEDLAFILAPEPDIGLEPSADFGLSEATKEFQVEFIRRGIKRVRGNMSEAARLLGLHRSNLYRKMRQLGMEVDEEE
ncbi:sigma-54 interaction domain-containing protein [Stratiformator vulcanicus]|uniref:Nitrogen assimilation regulatory protein n=1 Tax=Stratiformator vulcanicus TaxID=2527980 RepID=A0A517QX87_9PLAN|nr:sigma-54-dependent Fis family transcriptional regulator [Stratiformator vulcanicus]QDT36269.1 Nitrogen assimilation regulatory protein [Stratiformator vulcanicus]